MRVFVLTLLAMIAFAGNSLLCRQALKRTTIDAASFTFIRILSGAVVLWLVVMLRKGTRPKAGNWASALALFAYAAAFFICLHLSLRRHRRAASVRRGPGHHDHLGTGPGRAVADATMAGSCAGRRWTRRVAIPRPLGSANQRRVINVMRWNRMGILFAAGQRCG